MCMKKTVCAASLATTLMLTAFSACLDHTLPEDFGDGTEPSLFIALQSNFADYETWHRFDVITDPNTVPEGLDEIHAPAVRHVYINKLPAEGATSFPVGTIIVKDPSGPTADSVEIHAMVKRTHSGFNAQGAEGWQWFELSKNAAGDVVIEWSGDAPPTGEGYGCLPGQPCDLTLADCNNCHVSARGNDFVRTPALQLDQLSARSLSDFAAP